MEERQSIPTCMYRAGDGGTISKVFDHPDDIPEGWVDSPAKVGEEIKEPKRRGRPPGSKNVPQAEASDPLAEAGQNSNEA